MELARKPTITPTMRTETTLRTRLATPVISSSTTAAPIQAARMIPQEETPELKSATVGKKA